MAAVSTGPGGDRTRTDHLVPGGHDALHIQVRREECDDSVRDRLAVVDENRPKVPHDSGVVANLEPR